MKPLLAKGLLIALFFCFSFQIEASATSAPSGLVATGVSSSQVNLTWTDNSTSETGYTFAYDTNSALTNPTYTYAGGANTTSYSHTGRSPATTYYYKIKAEGNPDSAWSAVDSATTAPSGLGATATSNSAIALSWTGNGSNGAIQGYTYAYATTSSFAGATYKFVAGKGSSSATQTALGTATTYWFKIKAEGTSDAFDSPYGSVVATTTTPAGLAASVVSSSQITLSWTGNSANPNITGYTVAYATNASFSGAVYQFVGTATSFNHTGLSAGATYYYKVKAEGTSNSYDSAFTASIAATTSTGTIPAAPSALSATTVSSSQINLAWTDNSSNETGFEVKRATDSAFTQNVVWVGGIHASSYASTGLNPSTTYYFMVRAQGTAGSSAYLNAASATTNPSTPPTGIPISPHFAGMNAWMPEAVGSQNYGGHLEDYWGDVVESGLKIMRYGGSAVDKYAEPSTTLTRDQYVALVQAMRADGIEPVLQVPVCAACSTTHDFQEAAALVTYINQTRGLGVKYWSIGNEPDLPLDKHGNYGYTKPSQVAAYVMQFASAMKAADPDIKIIAPETAWYDSAIINGLTVCDGTADDSGTDEKFDITAKVPNKNYYYVDVISFHIYGFGGEQTTRDQVIDKLMSTGGFHDDLAELRTRLAGCDSHNGRTGDDVLKIAVTEANVNHQQPPNDDVYSLGATSFLGGQFWAELMGIAMQQGVDFVSFWSVAEGDDLGYLGHDDAARRPSYYHFKMVADNFRGFSIAAADADINDNVKVFASQDFDQIVVLIMNQEATASFNYTIRLDGGNVSGTNPVKIKVWAGVPVEYPGDAVLPPQSTTVLIFTPTGAIKKKIEYKLSGQADVGLEPDSTDYPPS